MQLSHNTNIREIRLGVEREGSLKIEEGCALKIGSRSGRGSLSYCEFTHLKYVSAIID